MRYPENADLYQRLEWYADHDVEGGRVLVALIDRLEQHFHYGDEAIHPED